MTIFRNLIKPYLDNNFNLLENINNVYQMNDDNISQLYKILPEIDFLFLQHTNDFYKSPVQNEFKEGAISSKTIISKLKPTCKVIFLPTLYFTGYFISYFRPDLLTASLYHNIDKNLLKIYIDTKKIMTLNN